MCTEILEHDNLSQTVYIVEMKFYISWMCQSTELSFLALSLQENIWNRKRTVLKWMCGVCWHMKESSACISLVRTSLQAIHSYTGELCSSIAKQQQQSYSPSTGWITLSFFSHCPWLLECDFLWSMRTNCMAFSFSWSYYASVLFSLGLCERQSVQPNSEYTG